MKVPIFNFPWECWKCKKEMIVTYPITEDVLNSIYKGNLALTFSNPQKKTVVGNVCPNCGVYQGSGGGLVSPEFTADKFRYEKSADVYICPAGQRLFFQFGTFQEGWIGVFTSARRVFALLASFL